MRTWTFVGLAAWLALVASAGGCVQRTRLGQIHDLRADLIAVGETLNDLYDAGKLSDKDALFAVDISRAAQASLDQAEASAEIGEDEDVVYFLKLGMAAFRELVAIRIRAERAGPATRPAVDKPKGVPI